MTNHEQTETIHHYWRERGYSIAAGERECRRVTKLGCVFPYHAVRSDLVNGLPAGYRGELAISAAPRRQAA